MGERDLNGVPKLVVKFYWAMKSFVSYLPGSETFYHKSLEVPSIKTCSYLRSDKKINTAKTKNKKSWKHIYYQIAVIDKLDHDLH